MPTGLISCSHYCRADGRQHINVRARDKNEKESLLPLRPSTAPPAPTPPHLAAEISSSARLGPSPVAPVASGRPSLPLVFTVSCFLPPFNSPSSPHIISIFAILPSSLPLPHPSLLTVSGRANSLFRWCGSHLHTYQSVWTIRQKLKEGGSLIC